MSKKRIYSEDANIWHISHEGAELEDPWNEPGEQVYTLSKTIEAAPDKATYVEIDFEKGIPTKLNGKKMDVPSYQVEVNDVISLTAKGTKIPLIAQAIKENSSDASWLEQKGAVAKIARLPERIDITEVIEEQLIIEYYNGHLPFSTLEHRQVQWIGISLSFSAY